MLLLVDIGNTNITIGRHDGKQFCSNERFKTRDNATLSQIVLFLQRIEFDEAVISSVVPDLTDVIASLINKPKLVINNFIECGLDKDSIPHELGSDILCNLIAAHHYYPDDYVTVADFGTAFSTETVSPQGKVLGVTIAPGIWTSIKSLFSNTAQIPPIMLDMPDTVLGLDTVSSVRAGVVFGTKGQLEAILEQTEKEIGHSVKLILTGGLSQYISTILRRDHITDIQWTLEGERLAFGMNKSAICRSDI